MTIAILKLPIDAGPFAWGGWRRRWGWRIGRRRRGSAHCRNVWLGMGVRTSRIATTESCFQSFLVRVIRDGGILFVLALCQSVAEKLHGECFRWMVFSVCWPSNLCRYCKKMSIWTCKKLCRWCFGFSSYLIFLSSCVAAGHISFWSFLSFLHTFWALKFITKNYIVLARFVRLSLSQILHMWEKQRTSWVFWCGKMVALSGISSWRSIAMTWWSRNKTQSETLFY